ncbi:WbqC family protein, partial [Dissulfurirhabdus thermomarina]
PIRDLYAAAPERLLDWNLSLLEILRPYFEPGAAGWVLQSELGATGRGTELLARIGRALGAGRLVAPRTARAHVDTAVLGRSGIEVEWFAYVPPVYPQLWGAFRKDLSALDLACTCGPRAADIVRRACRPWTP